MPHLPQGIQARSSRLRPSFPADQFLDALVSDLESGTPLQMLHRKLINAGIESEPAKVAVAAAIADSSSPEELRLCPECELLYVRTVSRCSICGTKLIEMPRSRAEPAEQPPDDEQEGTDVGAEYSVSAPAKLEAETAGPQEGEQTDTSRNRRGGRTILLVGIGLLIIGALSVLLTIFGGPGTTQDIAFTPQPTEGSLAASTTTPREAAPTATALERKAVAFWRDPSTYVPEKSDMPDGYVRDSSDSWESSDGALKAYQVMYSYTGDPFGEDADFVQFMVGIAEGEQLARVTLDAFNEGEPALEPYHFSVENVDESEAYVETGSYDEVPVTTLHVAFRRTNAVGVVGVVWVGEESTAPNVSEARHYVDLALDRLED